MRVLFISFCLFCTLPLLAQQNCYDDLRRRGLRLLEQKKYDKAIDIFFRARYCLEKDDKNKREKEDALDALIKRTQTAWIKELDEARQAAQDALEKLEAATAQTVELFCREIDQHILKLEYEQAAEKVAIANTLSANNPEVLKRLQEVAFFYTETNQSAKADSTLQLINQAPAVLERPILLEKIQNLDADHYDVLQRRYYPEMISIEGDTFMMGSEDGDDDEKPVHEVTVPSFKMARTETTVWQYALFAIASEQGLPESPGWGWWGDNPIMRVTWHDAITYANWLSQRQGLQAVYTGDFTSDNVIIKERTNGFRLPSEAEWEFAARGGNPEKGKNYTYAGSNNLDSVGWYGGNSKSRTQPVAQLKPNALGLYDLSGNVWEWMEDCWYDSYIGAPTDGSARRSGECTLIVLRGGSWSNLSSNCRVAYRLRYLPNDRDFNLGFRLAQD